jgi:hypothetical protein
MTRPDPAKEPVVHAGTARRVTDGTRLRPAEPTIYSSCRFCKMAHSGCSALPDDEMCCPDCSHAALSAAHPSRPRPAEPTVDGPWRVGRHYGIHVYEGDRPVATFHRAEDARRCVEGLTELSRLRERLGLRTSVRLAAAVLSDEELSAALDLWWAQREGGD